MLHLYGCPVTPEDARGLVATLLADGSPEALSAAAAIRKGIDRELYTIALQPFQRDAGTWPTPRGSANELVEVRGLKIKRSRANPQ